MFDSVRLPCSLRTLTLLLTGASLILVCLFPPQYWSDEIHTSGTPPRGFLFRRESRAKEWISLHMFLDRRARPDWRALGREFFLILAVGGVLYFVAAPVQRRLEQ